MTLAFKRSLYTPKGALKEPFVLSKELLYNRKSPYTTERVLHTLEKSTCNTIEGCDCGATNDTCFVKEVYIISKEP